MNLLKLQEAEAYFLELYPQGFEDVGLVTHPITFLLNRSNTTVK